MDNTFYQNLLDERSTLEQDIKIKEDKLRILNEFISAFFNDAAKETAPIPLVTTTHVTNGDVLKRVVIRYSKDLTIPKKVLAALSTFRQANVQQIANKIVELEPEYPLDKARKDVKNHISRLSREDNSKVKVVQRGSGKRSGIYSLKKEEAA